jgi:hypothetical protein
MPHSLLDILRILTDPTSTQRAAGLNLPDDGTSIEGQDEYAAREQAQDPPWKQGARAGLESGSDYVLGLLGLPQEDPSMSNQIGSVLGLGGGVGAAINLRALGGLKDVLRGLKGGKMAPPASRSAVPRSDRTIQQVRQVLNPTPTPEMMDIADVAGTSGHIDGLSEASRLALTRAAARPLAQPQTRREFFKNTAQLPARGRQVDGLQAQIERGRLYHQLKQQGMEELPKYHDDLGRALSQLEARIQRGGVGDGAFDDYWATLPPRHSLRPAQTAIHNAEAELSAVLPEDPGSASRLGSWLAKRFGPPSPPPSPPRPLGHRDPEFTALGDESVLNATRPRPTHPEPPRRARLSPPKR